MAITLPERCPRGLTCCHPLAQVMSDSGESFVCAGDNDGSDRTEPGDVMTLCVRSAQVDERTHVDERDLADQGSVIAQALSIIANRRDRRATATHQTSARAT